MPERRAAFYEWWSISRSPKKVVALALSVAFLLSLIFRQAATEC